MESDRLQAAMSARGDRGALLLLAGTREMLAVLLLDLWSVCNVHVLANVNRQSALGRRRNTRSGPFPGQCREHGEDDHGLTQIPQQHGQPIHGVQDGDIPEHAVMDIVKETIKGIKGEHRVGQEWIKPHVRSKVPAVKKVAEAIMKQLSSEVVVKNKNAKSVAKPLWRGVRNSC